MPFPNAQRVIYKKNPLNQVICQLRFPSILKIDTGSPVEFQERIMSQFPSLSEKVEFELQIPAEASRIMKPDDLNQFAKTSLIKNFQFYSKDESWWVNLTRTFVALSTNKYTRWEEFREKLTIPFNALNDIYSPFTFTRIGLRYVDVIKRSELSLPNAKWSELLQPYILGVLSSSDVADEVEQYESTCEIRLSDREGRVKITTKLVPDEKGEQMFVIDSDFFTDQKVPPDAVMEKLAFFNSRSTRLIRWCITDRLHRAMEPSPL